MFEKLGFYATVCHQPYRCKLKHTQSARFKRHAVAKERNIENRRNLDRLRSQFARARIFPGENDLRKAENGCKSIESRRTWIDSRPVDDDHVARVFHLSVDRDRSTWISFSLPIRFFLFFFQIRVGTRRIDAVHFVRLFAFFSYRFVKNFCFFFFFFRLVLFFKIHDVSYRGRLEPMGARVRRSVSVIGGCRVLPTTDGVGGSVLVEQCRLNGHRILERCRRQ